MYNPNYVMPPPIIGMDIITLCVIAAGKAIEYAEKLLPLLLPPTDLRVTSYDGEEITGILLVERNKVLGGIVIRTSGRQDPTPARTTPVGRPLVDIYRDDSTRLRGWADNDEDEPWPR